MSSSNSKVNSEILGSLKFIDQIIAAINTYVLILILMKKGDFLNLGKLTFILGFYTFWIGVTRITTINEMIFNAEKNFTLGKYLKRGLRVCAFSILQSIFFLTLNTSLYILFMFIILIFLGCSQEIIRQYFILKSKAEYALAIDIFWLLSSVISIFYVNMRKQLRVDDYLTSMVVGAGLSLFFGAILYKRIPRNDLDDVILHQVPNWASIIPIINSFHMLGFNWIFTYSDRISILGSYRGLQTIFLPAIFMINVQANYFQGTSLNMRNRPRIRTTFGPKYLGLFFSLLSMSTIFALIYSRQSTHDDMNVGVCLLVCLSIVQNFESNYRILNLLTSKKFPIFLLGKFFWLLLSLSMMAIFVTNLIVLLFCLVICDAIMNLFSRILLNAEYSFK
jgi:hypothetical protein